MAKAKQIAHQLRSIQQMATQSGPALACKPADQLAKQFPKHADAMALAGELRLAAGQPDLAVKRLRRADRLRPRDPKIRALLGRALRLSGEPKAALPCLRDAWTRLRSAPWALELAAAQRELGQVDEAAQTLRSALDLSADPALRFNLANLLRERGRSHEAVPLFEELVARGERQPSLFNNLGLALLESGQPDEAARQLRQATQLDPQSPLAYMNHARACIAQGDFDTAQQALRTAATLAANHHETLHAVANLQRDALDLSAAIHHLRTLATTSVDARHDLIATLEEANELDQALNELGEVDSETNDPRFALLAAKIARRRGDAETARHKLDREPLSDPELEQRRLSEIVQCCDLLDDANGAWTAMTQRGELQSGLKVPDSNRYQRYFDYYDAYRKEPA